MIRFALLALSLALTGKYTLADEYADLLTKAAAATAEGNYDLAISEYQTALKLRPGAPEALNNLAVIYYQVRRYAEAYALASGLWETHSELKSAALIAGLAAVRCGKPDQAIAPLNHVLISDASNRDALLGLASAHFALKQYSQAVEVYRRQISFLSRDSLAWYGLAVCLERSAEDSSKRLSLMPGGSGYSKQLLAEYLQSAGDKKLAEEAFGELRIAQESAPPEVIREYQTARTLADRSREAFETFVSLAPESWQAEVFFGDVARQHGDLTGALSRYQKAAETNPDSPAPDLGIGTVYWEMGDFDRATQYLRETLKRNPQAMQAVFELANIAVRRHSDGEAIPLLNRYLTAQPDASAAHADLGRAFLHLAQYAKAVGELEKGAASDMQGDVHYQLSIALRKLGRTREAEDALAKSTSIRKERLSRDERLHSVH